MSLKVNEVLKIANIAFGKTKNWVEIQAQIKIIYGYAISLYFFGKYNRTMIYVSFLGSMGKKCSL